MKGITRIAIISTVLVCLSAPAYANRTLVFQVHSERGEKNGKGAERRTVKESKSEERTDYGVTVVLGRDFFMHDDGMRRTIYDLERKRIFTVDDRERTYRDDSLYSEIGFRTYELKNREFLGDVMQKAGVENNPMSAALSEHLLSLEIEDAGTKVQEEKRDGGLAFSADGRPLMTVGPDGKAADRSELGLFLRFLRYRYGGHPAVLRRIAELGRIPGRLSVNRYDATAGTLTLTLVSDQTGPDTSYSLAGLEEKADPGGALALTMLRIKREPAEVYRKQCDEVLRGAAKAYEKKQYLASMLAYIEYSLQTGRALPEPFQERRKNLEDDASVREFFSVLTPKSKEEANRALPVYGKLRKKAGAKEYVLMIFEANILDSLGRDGEAEKLFLRVLERNPYITGVYKDLGDIYFNRYLTQKAWQCWDLGRKLAPDFKNFRPIDEFEKKLAQEHPEYF